MNKLLSLALALPLAGCVIGTSNDDPSGGNVNGAGDGNGNGNGNGTGGGDSGNMTADTTWTGSHTVTGPVTVAKGTTLTIAKGTTVTFSSTGTSIGSMAINGTVDIQGTKDEIVKLVPSTTGGFYGGFTVSTGGTFKMSYGHMTGAEILVDGGTVTVTDSRMSNTSHDLLVVNAGVVDMTYSAIGLEPGTGTDTTHCDMHFGGSGTTIKVSHSNISTSAYGLMLYGGTNVDLTYNNWFSNPIQIDTSPGVTGDISNGWFDKAPTVGSGATLTFNNKAAARITDAGPR